MVLPEDRSIGLVRRSGDACERAEFLDLVEVFCVIGARERVWSVGAERFCVRDNERPHVPDPRRGVVREVGWRRTPDTGGWRYQVRRWSEASVVQSRFEHGPGCRLPDRDPITPRSRWVVGESCYVRIVL